MRASNFAAALYISFSVVGSAAGHNIISALAPYTPILRASFASSEPTSLRSMPSSGGHLELRQAAGVAPVAAPLLDLVAPAVPVAAPPAPVNEPGAIHPVIVPPVIDPAIAPAVAILPPAVNPPPPPAPPAAVPVVPSATSTTSTLPLPPAVTGDDMVTVQWVETHIGTLRTWVPKTYTFHFQAMSQAPLPGVGSIGMGTLTGEIGQTQTIYIVAAEAPTPAVDAKRAVVAAVVAGVAGLAI